MNNDVTIPASHIGQRLTLNVRVTGLRTLRARWWFAARLLRLAARVAGCGIQIDVQS
jgi:hypothetical protein